MDGTYRTLVYFNLSVCEVRHLLERIDRDQHRANVGLKEARGLRKQLWTKTTCSTIVQYVSTCLEGLVYL